MGRKAHLYRTLYSAAAVDGKVTKSERTVLRDLRRRLGVSASEAERIGRDVRSGKPTFFVPRDVETRISLFDDVERVVNADGASAAKERSFLRKIRARFTDESVRCPRCAVGLWKSGSRFGCRECGGIWIRGGERVRTVLNVKLRTWVRDYVSTESCTEGWGGRTCPSCFWPLEVFTYGPPPERVYIEPCRGCRGVFVEPDQVSRMVELARDECGIRSRRQQEAQTWALVEALVARWRSSSSRRGVSGPRQRGARRRTRTRPSSAR